MPIPVDLNPEAHTLYFEGFQTPLEYEENPLEDTPSFVRAEVADRKTEKVLSVYLKTIDLRKLGISMSVWKRLSVKRPQSLSILIKRSAEIQELLQKAIPLITPHLKPHCLAFFQDPSLAVRIITQSIYEGLGHFSKVKNDPEIEENVPGMYFGKSGAFTEIFINLKKTPPLGSGTFGKVRKVLWLTAPQKIEIIAKKSFREGNFNQNYIHFITEFKALEMFANKRGIISPIFSGIFGPKCVLFFPIYQCDLHTFLFHPHPPFSLTFNHLLELIRQWVEGLAAISEKGIHGDISPSNLLLKKTGSSIEGVISDFGAFQPYGEEEYGLTTWVIAPPEYHKEKKVSSKQDVWALGLSLLQLTSLDVLPAWKFKTRELVANWISELSPHWALKYFKPDTPPFLIELIDHMLDPRPEERPSAKEVFDRFLAATAPQQSQPEAADFKSFEPTTQQSSE